MFNPKTHALFDAPTLLATVQGRKDLFLFGIWDARPGITHPDPDFFRHVPADTVTLP